VRWELSAALGDKGTLVHLTHSQFPNAEERDGHDEGWDDYFLGPMKEWVENMGKAIQRYIENLRSHVEEGDSVSNEVFRKAIYFIVMDTLSKAAFPGVTQHHKRVIEFIDMCSNWMDKDRVSSQQLLLTLQENGIVTGQLFTLIQQYVFSWQRTTKIRPIQDPIISELIPIATEQEITLVQDAQYKELYYLYRNTLIHEFREPGIGTDLFLNDDSPYYHSRGSDPWQLIFPVGFLKRLCLESLDGLAKHLQDNHLNPYDAYKFGSMWRAK
jgi:hypothetical protein